MKQCTVCGNEFVPKGRQKYCGTHCANKARKKPPELAPVPTRAIPMDDHVKVRRKAWAESLLNEQFFKEWAGIYNAEAGEIAGGEMARNLEAQAAYAEDDETALLARKMLNVHKVYMRWLLGYIRGGKVSAAQIEKDLRAING